MKVKRPRKGDDGALISINVASTQRADNFAHRCWTFPTRLSTRRTCMALLPTTWNPLRQLTRFDPLNDLDEVFRGLGRQTLSRQYQDMMEMRLDVTEDDTSYYVNVDIPGVEKNNIDVSVQGNSVTINAEVEREKSRESKKEVYSERFIGKAFRSFSLPTDVDSTKSQASYDGGVLKLKLPKIATDTSRHLSIN
jgi:HSP20 family protein